MCNLQFLVIFILTSVVTSLFGQMTPNAPVKNFRLPRFGANGFTDWVLQGARGLYDGEEQVRVEGMSMRVYTGDQRMALELSMDSPWATLRLKENHAYSDDTIEIIGGNFSISGVGWDWSGESREVIVKSNTAVTFNQEISGAFRNTGNQSTTTHSTEIQSDRLLLRTNEEAYYFEFAGDVFVASDQMNLRCERLIIMADPPQSRDSRVPTNAPNKLDSIHQMIARKDVVIRQGGKSVRGNEAKFFPREQKVDILGSASIEARGAYLYGDSIQSKHGEIVIKGAQSVGRAQMILSGAGGLGIHGNTTPSSETILIADNIIMSENVTENHFLFEGSVEVMSGGLYMRSNKMSIAAHSSGEVIDKTDDQIKVGLVKTIISTGDVQIERSSEIITADKVIFFLDDERAVLTGDPKITNAQAVVIGDSMELNAQTAIIRGESNSPVIVRLPEIPDMGYKTFTPGLSNGAGLIEDSPVELHDTVVKSQLLEMVEEPVHTRFLFSDEVEVSATNLNITCENLNIITRKIHNLYTLSKTSLEVERIEAVDNVLIAQKGRTSTSGKAFILPKESKVVLEGLAVVQDADGRVAGHRITLLQGQRRAIVEGGGPAGERARITLPAIPSQE